MRIDPHNVLAMPIVSGDYATTSLSSEGVSQNSAEGITLIAAVQTRSNNRFVIAGSLEFFSDSYYEENADNKILGDQISLCTFLSLSPMQGCASSSGICASRTSSTPNTSEPRTESRRRTRFWCRKSSSPISPHPSRLPSAGFTASYGRPEVAGNNVVYRVKDELWYSVNVQEWDGSDWKPYKVSDKERVFSVGRRSAARVRDAEPLHSTESHLCCGARQWRLLHCRHWRGS